MNRGVNGGLQVRLQKDLDRWIADGLVPAAAREPILAGVVEPRRLEASAALAAVGGLLLGAAVIAFTAANWNGIPRLGRFGLILGLFLGVCAAAAWAGERRPLARNVLLLVAALIYAAAIGLTGQIFDIAGDPRSALHGAGLAAIVLALAGRSSGAAIAALACCGPRGLEVRFHQRELAAALAAAGRAAGRRAGLGVAVEALDARREPGHGGRRPADPDLAENRRGHEPGRLRGALIFVLLAGAARRLDARGDPVAGVAYGWWVWAALAFFAAAGFGPHPPEALLHRALWLAVAGGVIALGLHDRRTAVTAAGVVAMAGAIAAILGDLGLGLMTAAAVFAMVPLAALAGGFALRRRAKR